MPSLKQHVKRSMELGLNEDTATQINEWMDHGFGLNHFKYRKKTHNPETAIMLGFLLGDKQPRRASLAALRHISDDEEVSASGEDEVGIDAKRAMAYGLDEDTATTLAKIMDYVSSDSKSSLSQKMMYTILLGSLIGGGQPRRAALAALKQLYSSEMANILQRDIADSMGSIE